jgi:membrane protein implicated in regulation of membrane protease activity
MSLFTTIGDLLGVTTPSTLEIIFMSCAILGTAFFLIMMALMLIGDIVGGVVDTAFDTDFSLDSDLSFELFSLQGMAAGIMMFGYVGMYVTTSTDQEVLAVLAGGAAAAASLYLVKMMMQGITGLQTDGTMVVLNAIGERGTVHSRIKPEKSGEVQVPIEGALRTMAARAKDKSAHIPTGTFIKVVDVIGSTLIVEELSEEE